MTTPKNELLFLALGGSNEIGMNVNLYGCQGKWVMVDLGLTFANAEYPGVELILPDLEFIEQRKDDLLGIVLTHGHEDHIGAVAYFAADLGVPLYATPFTATLIRGKLEEEGIADSVELNIIPMEGSFDLGPFGFQFVTLAHSILEMSACLITTPYGKIFHTGDWKLDERPVIGTPSTADQLTAIGEEGILALVCDSTNAFNADDSGSEGSVKADLLKSVKEAKGRVLLTTFASNAARLQTMGEVARETGRTLCFAGRSLHRIIDAAQANGYLKDMPKTVDMEAVDSLARHEVMVVATGGQGEARAALARIAEGNHPVKLEEGDTVIFSSKQIPGNEIAIGVIMNKLAERNILTVTEKQAHVHVSGHPGQPELALLYDWIKPSVLIPVHGERRHMAEQARFAKAHGVKSTLVQSNGDVVRLAPGKPEIIGQERTGRLILDGDTIISADGATINERRRLSWYGLISVAFALDERDRLLGEPQIRLHGVPIEEDLEDFLEEASAAAVKAIRENKGDFEKLRESVRLAVRRVATSWTGKKPIVDVMILETA
ncbi:MAG: MBL fold hydrolase [Sphingopyxis sp.]|nr:MBL fold hydrolase [Sphingopyxis sp.]